MIIIILYYKSGVCPLYIYRWSTGGFPVIRREDINNLYHYIPTPPWHVTRHLSSWTLVLLTLERTTSVYFPFRCKQMCSFRNVVCVWITFVGVLIAVNFHFFWSVDIVAFYANAEARCNPISSWEWFLVGPWFWIDICINDFIPFAVILSGNVLIITKTTIAQRARAGLTQIQVGIAGENNKEKSRLMNSTTYILILISGVFLLTHTPDDVYYIANYFGLFSQQAFWLNEELQLFYGITNFVYYTNCAVEFILYFFGGRKFRSAFLDMFGIKKANKYWQKYPMTLTTIYTEWWQPARDTRSVLRLNPATF